MYKPILAPERVEKGCEGGFCEPPVSLLDELRTVVEKRYDELFQKLGVADAVAELSLEMMKEYREKIDEETIDEWTLHCLMDNQLEMATLTVINESNCNALSRLTKEDRKNETD